MVVTKWMVKSFIRHQLLDNFDMLMFSVMLFIIPRQFLIHSQIFRKLEENSIENKPQD